MTFRLGASVVDIDLGGSPRGSLAAALLVAANTAPDRVFLVDYTRDNPCSMTYAQTLGRVVDLARGLRHFGVRPSDRIAVVLPNRVEAVLVWLAASMIGAVHVPIDPDLKETGIARAFRIGQPALVVTDLQRASDVDQAKVGINGKEPLLFVVETPSTGRSEAPERSGDRMHDFEALCAIEAGGDAGSDAEAFIAGRPSSAVLAAIFFTSGSTGGAKGVAMSDAHQRLFAATCRAQVGLGDTDTYLVSNPVCHANALVLGAYPAILAGAQVALYPRFSASRWVTRLRESGATVTNLIGPMMQWICEQLPMQIDREHDLTRVRSVPAVAGLEDQFRSRFGVEDVLASYGQTEIGLPVVTFRGVTRPAGAAGHLLRDFFDARFVDRELQVRPLFPGTISSGYVGDPDTTADAWAGDWFRTGDLLVEDDEGWYYYRGRKKDVIRRRGKNISALDVEEAIEHHPAVIEAAVVGVEDPVVAGEELIHAYVVARSAVSAEAIVRSARDVLPNYAIPGVVEFVDDLPRTAAGKVDKPELRRMIQSKVRTDNEC
jgi:crotonobetaine/carnitine-CoA ligase